MIGVLQPLCKFFRLQTISATYTTFAQTAAMAVVLPLLHGQCRQGERITS